jgi:hypothetical protein
MNAKLDDPFLGNLALVRDLANVPCKGNWVAARRRYVLEEYGKDAADEVEGRLSGRAREAFVAPPLTMSLSDVGVVVEIDRAIVDGPMQGQIPRMKDFGGRIARYDLPVVYRVFFRVGTPGFVIGRLGLVYSQYIKRGKITVRAGANEAVVTLTESPLPYYLCEYGIAGWFEAALNLAGGKSFFARQLRCVHRGDPTCVWNLVWR